ncbi:AMP-binding protein [Bradyrhizobium sp. CSA207]|uniref:class I adenylate-forming enzyme family protein n=1 Tax=Bradyrhizobium sp. CSA207 TaxID=2698826 RepID=UPI0023AE752C|nr:AMP-binding protein [Bradyrhizobium sp. CSA207]MDE5444345.1 AMP-binding protein [Bradyrhizobium sp. CSA207]
MPSRIGDALRWHATYTPEKVAIISSEGEQTYARLWSRVRRLADSLTGIGVQPGDRVAVVMQNSSRYLELYQAAALLGVTVVPLNFRFVASEVEYVVNHSGASALVFDSQFIPMVQSLRDELLTVGKKYIVSDGPEGVGSYSYEDLVQSGREVEPEVPADLSTCYFQGYTSGTTGFPKGCVNPHREFADCLRRIATVYGITSDDREFVAAPLFHEAPALFALLQLFRGGTVIVSSDSTPANVFGMIDRNRATWAFMVPTMWASMVASEEIDRFDLGSLRMVISGGSPLLTHTKEALIKRLPNAGLNEFYGGTEVGLVTNLGPADQLRKVRSVGRPVIGMFVELRDENGHPVPQGEVGEIHIGGATLIREYFNNPQATASARSGSFFTLGDMGRFDEEGFLYIVDRKKDMIISGGENIYPNDIEDILYKHPAVNMAAVVGAPDPKWGEIVVAAVTLRPGQTVSESDLIAHCKASLSSFKVPKKIDFRDELPMSSFGKILRRDVRKSYWEKHDVQV